MVSRTVSFELKDLNKIQKKIENGEVDNLSEFVQKAIKNELNRWLNLTKEFNDLLKHFYFSYIDKENPPIPLKTIKDYLELEGVTLENNDLKRDDWSWLKKKK